MKIEKLNGKRVLVFSRIKSRHFISTSDFGDVKQALTREHSRLHEHLADRFGHDRIFFIQAQHGHLVEVMPYNLDDKSRRIFGDGAMYVFYKPEARPLSRRTKTFLPPIIACTTGDCPHLLIEAEKHYCRLVGLVHSGWKGSVANIVGQTIKKIKELGFSPAILTVGLWAGICGNCYEVNKPVRDALFAYPHAFRRGRDDGHWQLSLAAVIREQLRAAGVSEAQITESRFCSHCYKDEKGEPLFYSYRRLYQEKNEMRRNGLFIMA